MNDLRKESNWAAVCGSIHRMIATDRKAGGREESQNILMALVSIPQGDRIETLAHSSPLAGWVPRIPHGINGVQRRLLRNAGRLLSRAKPTVDIQSNALWNLATRFHICL